MGVAGSSSSSSSASYSPSEMFNSEKRDSALLLSNNDEGTQTEPVPLIPRGDAPSPDGTRNKETEKKDGLVNGHAVEGGLCATQEMCHFCFDVIVDELLPNSSVSDSKKESNDYFERKYLRRRRRQLPEVKGKESGDHSAAVVVTDWGSSDDDDDNGSGVQSGCVPFVETLPQGAECPLFVTWDKQKSGRNPSNEYELRGCIGTLSPRPLRTAIREYALTAAFRDRRFSPITKEEVALLRVGVSLLVNYEECADVHDWTVGVHGIIIKFNNKGNTTPPTTSAQYNATYLPEVPKEQGWTQQETVQALIRKAGYRGLVDDDFLKAIHCTRYQSSRHSLSFEDYVSLVGENPLVACKDGGKDRPQRSWRPCFRL